MPDYKNCPKCNEKNIADRTYCFKCYTSFGPKPASPPSQQSSKPKRSYQSSPPAPASSGGGGKFPLILIGLGVMVGVAVICKFVIPSASEMATGGGVQSNNKGIIYFGFAIIAGLALWEIFSGKVTLNFGRRHRRSTSSYRHRPLFHLTFTRDEQPIIYYAILMIKFVILGYLTYLAFLL